MFPLFSTLFPQMIRQRRNDHIFFHDQEKAQDDGGLVMQKCMPPFFHDKLRQEHCHRRAVCFFFRFRDVELIQKEKTAEDALNGYVWFKTILVPPQSACEVSCRVRAWRDARPFGFTPSNERCNKWVPRSMTDSALNIQLFLLPYITPPPFLRKQRKSGKNNDFLCL